MRNLFVMSKMPLRAQKFLCSLRQPTFITVAESVSVPDEMFLKLPAERNAAFRLQVPVSHTSDDVRTADAVIDC